MTTKTAAPESPATAPTVNWPPARPVPEPVVEKRSRAQRGMPVGPALTATGNAVGLAATGAYELGGATAVAAFGALAFVGGATAVARRRSTVHRKKTARAHRVPSTQRFNGSTAQRTNATAQRRNGSTAQRRNGQHNGSTAQRLNATAQRSAQRRNGSTDQRNGATAQRTNATAQRLNGPTQRLNGSTAQRSTQRRNGSTDQRNGATHSGVASRRFSGAGESAALKAAVARTARAAETSRRKVVAAAGATGRGVRKAWTADRSRKVRGAVLDAARAVIPALWAGLRKRSLRAALARLKEVWARRRKARAERVPETVADSVRGSAVPVTASASVREGITMPGHHFVAPAEQMAAAAAQYDPQGMLQVGQDFVGLEEALRLVAESMKVTVENASAKQPVAPQIIQMMEQIYMLQVKAADMAAELKPAFEKLHLPDLERHRNPRTGERMWDIASNEWGY